LASGDVIGLLHSDDLYNDNRTIEKVANAFENEELDGVYGDLVYTYKRDFDKILRYWKSKPYNFELLKKGWMPPHPTLFLKKEIYEMYGSFDLNFKIAADYDFMLRILDDGVKVKYLPEILYKMRVGGASNKSLKNIVQKSSEDLRALRKNNIGGYYSLALKNISKISQFFTR